VVESILVHISDDADDGVPAGMGIERAEVHALAERVAIREETLRQGLVDDRALQRAAEYLLLRNNPGGRSEIQR
jgi:hypothetical protein